MLSSERLLYFTGLQHCSQRSLTKRAKVKFDPTSPSLVTWAWRQSSTAAAWCVSIFLLVISQKSSKDFFWPLFTLKDAIKAYFY